MQERLGEKGLSKYKISIKLFTIYVKCVINIISFGKDVIFMGINNTIVQRKKDRQNTNDDIIKKLKQSEEEIEKGEGIDADEVFKELRQQYGY